MVRERDQSRSESLDFSKRLIPYNLIRRQKFGVGTLSRIPHFAFHFQNKNLKNQGFRLCNSMSDTADICDTQNTPPGGRNKT